jgi:ATP-dependent RNA helicase RhlE
VMQVVEQFQEIAKYTNLIAVGTYGGANIKSQMAEIAKGADVVVGTPGRLNDLIMNRTISSKLVKRLVIDEVDEMLKLGFRAEIKNLLDLLPDRRQTMMFSATITEDIDALVTKEFSRAERIETAATGTPLSSIKQVAYRVPNFNTKINFLAFLLKKDKAMKKVLVFAGNKRVADAVNRELEFQFPNQVAVIHGNKSQNTRFKTVDQFESGECRVLIASDLIARGLDVTEVSHVINVNIPDAPEDYIHRIGRTGRADKKGVAISMFTETEKEQMMAIEALMGKKISIAKMPDEVEVSTILTSEEEKKPGMKIIQVRQPKVADRGLAFHDKKNKNKKVPIKVSREDKKRLKLGKRYGTTHGGLGKKKKR